MICETVETCHFKGMTWERHAISDLPVGTSFNYSNNDAILKTTAVTDALDQQANLEPAVHGRRPITSTQSGGLL